MGEVEELGELQESERGEKSKEERKPRREKRSKKYDVLMVYIIIGIIVSVAIVVLCIKLSQKEQPTILTEATLVDLVNVSELATYQSIYNSYCTVYSTKDPEEVEYHVSYNSRANIGIDFSLVKFQVDEERKVVTMILPEVEVLDVEVDISTLDFLFVNDDADAETVSAEAYKACTVDAMKKVKENGAIYDIAKQGAQNACTALVKPFIEQLSTPYELEIAR